MDDTAREFGLFIDGLRIERKISRDDLCDEIMSLSQYKRYLKGDTSIPNDKLVQLADRLKFSINDFYTLFQKKHNDEYNNISKIYNLIKALKFEEALLLSKSMQNDVIVSQYNKLFFDFCLINIQHSLKKVSDVHVLGIYSKLINYPECSKNETFNMVEISILIKIVAISSKMGNYEPINTMYRIVTSKNFNYSSSNDPSFLPSIYTSLAKTLGMQGENQKVVEITNIGIEYCLIHETSNALGHLYFYNSIANLNLENKEIALLAAKKCFMFLFVEDKTVIFNAFKIVFEKEFDMPLDNLIKL